MFNFDFILLGIILLANPKTTSSETKIFFKRTCKKCFGKVHNFKKKVFLEKIDLGIFYFIIFFISCICNEPPENPRFSKMNEFTKVL